MSDADAWTEAERKKYEAVWTYDRYRDQADGDPVVDAAFKLMGCKPGESLVDWGCGKGTPAAKFQQLGLAVTGIDIAHNCLDAYVKIPLLVACLWEVDDPRVYAHYAFCTDVLEHIPSERLEAVLKNIVHHTKKAAFIQVCCSSDSFGKRMDPPQVLHLTVLGADTWLNKLARHFRRVGTVPVSAKSRAAFVCWKE